MDGDGSTFELRTEFYPVPIVIVFTKFDKPVNKIKRKLPKTVDRDKVARDAAKDKFQKDYAESLSTLPASIPHVEVSSTRSSRSLVSTRS